MAPVRRSETKGQVPKIAGAASQHLGHRLDDRAGERGGRCGARLSRGQKQHRHAAPHADLEDAAGVFGELERRHHEAVRVADEGPRAPGGFAPGEMMEKLQRLLGPRRGDKAAAHVLGGARHAGVERVEVEGDQILHVRRRQRALEEMDVVEGLGDARGVVEIERRRVPIAVALGIDDHRRRARRAEMNALATGHDVMLGALAEEREIAARPGDHVLHQGGRKAQPAVITESRARTGADLDTRGDGVADAHLLEHLQRRPVDSLDPHLGERSIPPARQAGAHRPHLVRQRCRALRHARRAAPASPATPFGFRLRHGDLLRPSYCYDIESITVR
jgi:hypothetical protein